MKLLIPNGLHLTAGHIAPTGQQGALLAPLEAMEYKRRISFRILDEYGYPLSPHIEEALLSLTPRFLRHFPRFRDDPSLVDVLEEAGRKISRREQASGPIERLHGYLWVTLRTIAISRLRRGSARLTQRTLPSEEGQAALEATPSILGSADEIERRILLRQVLNTLSPEERLVCAWKRAGFSSHEIARRRGGTAAAIDKMLSRARERVRAYLGCARREDDGPGTKNLGDCVDGPSRPTSAHRRTVPVLRRARTMRCRSRRSLRTRQEGAGGVARRRRPR